MAAQGSKPNSTVYLEGTNGKFAVYVFFTKDELEVLTAVAGKTNMAKYIRDLVLKELTLGE